MKNIAVAVDGPAGSGKSTVAKLIAKNMNIVYIDTGAMYRTVGLYCIENGIDTKNEKAVCSVLDDIKMDIKAQMGGQTIFLNGVDVTSKVRTQEAGRAASDVAVILAVREKLVQIQRNMAKGTSVIMDGRDIGTNVLPKAEVKIFLNASVEERAKRRVGELLALGENPDFDEVKEQIRKRDENDTNRKHNPLRKAEDAVEIDTTGMTIDEVIDKISDIIREKIS
ncbi:cytidylate kinase [Tyzzerella sp. An114]|uniref:(d)CMP kinase n=1 Tax=Tyzzerella sp. An114 TaxID=1965545 RepID=UPI000B4486EF|nr:(d)CMP kinase [Tyzzerella sp. An114]OUQ60519.1 cytidylate kinase [Tyzzerella sp. An114]HIT72286.1 (d)CMP kinase [Candidatus Fimicola cottocaccae]